MRPQTFVNYGNFRWLKINAAAALILTAIFLSDHPLGGRTGGTVFGYTVGTLSALGIVYLMCFGIRKRYYSASATSLQGWLAAHIWLGVSLTYLALLHSGFRFGLNVHTAAYVLMVLTIASGIWGTVAYRTVPYFTKSNRGGASLKALVASFDQLSSEIQKNAKGGGPELAGMVATLDTTKLPSVWSSLGDEQEELIDSEKAARYIGRVPDPEKDAAHKIIGLIDKRFEVVHQIKQEQRALALLKIWLYLHVPLSFGCVAALVIHIVSVLYYR